MRPIRIALSRMWLAFTAIFAAGTLLTPPAMAVGGAGTAAPAAPTTRLEMAMSLFAGGIPLGKVDMDAKFTGSPTSGKYHVVSNLETSGVVNVFWQSQIQGTVSGRLEGHTLVPDMYDTFYTGHAGHHQQIALTYENGYPAKLYANPPYPTVGYEVKPEEKKGTFDPLTAVLYLFSGVGVGSDKCNLTAPIFDGRRRYSVTMSKLQDTDIKMDNGLYHGPGMLCEVVYRQISGYSPRVLKDVHFPRIYAWVAPFKGNERTYYIPLRVWAKSPYGIVAAVTSSLKIDGAPPR